MDIKTYYNTFITFFEDLKSKYADNTDVIVLFNSNQFVDANEIKFVSKDEKRYTFSITLWTNIIDFPRIGFYIKHPNKEEYYEALDIYNGGNDIDIENLILAIKTILSNNFVFEYEFLDGKELGVTYIYSIYNNKKVEKIEARYSKKSRIYFWKRKDIIKKRYEFQPWVIEY